MVGLTGGIGSGKTTVALLLSDRGATVVDVDALAREVVARGTPALREIVDRFGQDVVTAGGDLDRAALADVVFADTGRRRDLEEITHPRIAARLEERLTDLDDRVEGGHLVVLDHPLLVETGAHRRCDAVVVVTAPEDARVDRLVRRRGMRAGDVRARMASQTSDAARRAVATHVIDNGGDLADLAGEIDRVHADLEASARGAATGGPR